MALPYNVVRLRGSRSPIENGIWQDVWSGAERRVPFVDTPQALEVVSGDAANTSDGTGARRMRFQLLDANLDLIATEVTLNGLTPAPLPGGPWLRSNGAIVIEAGSYGWIQNAPVNLRQQNDQTIWDHFTVDTNESRRMIYTVPRNRRAAIIQWSVDMIERVQNASCDTEGQARPPGHAWHTLGIGRLDEITRRVSNMGDQEQRFPQGTDFRLSVNGTLDADQIQANAIVHEWVHH